MIITFLGATHEVTGSCIYLEACGKKIMIDCGLEQGRDTFENQEIPVSADQIDVVLLTHAHMDHAGKLPMLYKQGFRGEIHATGATKALCNLMLRDSAHIQESEAEWRNRKGKRSGEGSFSPIYNMEDAIATLGLFIGHGYGEIVELFEGLQIRFIDSGHLLGSSSVELWMTEDNMKKKIVFSGDIGNINQPLINDPQLIEDADYIVMETTYGDRNHGERTDYLKELTEILSSTFQKGGNVVIPSFAVGRTQMLLYYLRKIKADKSIKGHESFKVYVDSPLAIEATEIFKDYMKGYFDEEAMALVNKGINPLSFQGLQVTITTDESKAINFDDSPKVIIASSGMCDAGRIRHHLKHNLWRENSTILFVGHQSKGTLGGMLLDGVKEVKLFGEQIKVNARIHKLEGVSGHADQEGLLRWIQAFKKKPDHVFLVHGDDETITEFQDHLSTKLGYNVSAPYSGTVYDLAMNKTVTEGKRIEVEAAVKNEDRTNLLYKKLLQSGEKLLNIISGYQGASQQRLAKFTEQVDEMNRRWDKRK